MTARRNTHTAEPDPRNADVRIYVNGELVPRDEAKISVFDAGFLVGDGIWEGVRLHHGRFPWLDRHLDRLFAGLATARIELGLDRAGVEALLHEVVAANGMTDGVHVRLMVTRGRKKTPSQHPDLTESGPTVVVIPEYKRANAEIASRGISLFTATIRRPPPDSLDQRLNCHSKLHEVIALIQAYEAGADEALMLDPTGAVATCNATNFFAVTPRGEVLTSTGQYCLNGVTRGVVIELCGELGIPCAERPFSLVDVYGASEAFVTGTFGGLTPVTSVDGREIPGNGPVTQRLRAAYAEALERA